MLSLFADDFFAFDYETHIKAVYLPNIYKT
jgi:hypothetical protein